MAAVLVWLYMAVRTAAWAMSFMLDERPSPLGSSRTHAVLVQVAGQGSGGGHGGGGEGVVPTQAEDPAEFQLPVYW